MPKVTLLSERTEGGEIAQEIDAAAMSVYMKHQYYTASVSSTSLDHAVTDFNDADVVSGGAVIQF